MGVRLTQASLWIVISCKALIRTTSWEYSADSEKKRVAVMFDIEAMFHCFKVEPVHRDYLRFLWWSDATLNSEPVEYRMTAYLFGTIFTMCKLCTEDRRGWPWTCIWSRSSWVHPVRLLRGRCPEVHAHWRRGHSASEKHQRPMCERKLTSP